MKKILTATAVAAVLAISGVALIATGSDRLVAQESGGDAQLSRSQVEAIVRDYLLTNPEILIDMQERLTAKQQEEQQAAVEGEIASASDQIFHNPRDVVLGNPEGDVTVVEFFDYNCGYCRRALSDMEALLESDNNLRFVLKEFPILGPDSQKAHVVSLAFHALAPEHYEEYHKRLLSSDGRANEETAIEIARDLGIDEAALREEMKNPQIAESINETYELANRLQISGTPSYVIGNEIMPGAIGHDLLSEKIADARQ